jgi:putative membrane protein
MSFLVHLVVTALLLALVARIVRDISVDGAGAALLAALVLGVVNAIVRPLMILLTLPLTIITLGLFLLVVNALMLQLVAAVVPGFRVRGFAPAFWGALLLAVFNLLVDAMFFG